MGDQLPVQMGDLNDKLKEKMQDAFLSLIPEEKWDQLIDHYIGTHGEKILEPILQKALVPIVQERVDEWVAKAKDHLVDLHRIGPTLSQTFEEACRKTSADLIGSMAKNIQAHVLEAIDMNMRFCTNCGRMKNMNTACPGCGQYN